MAKQRIEDLEQSLTSHPLALYPHLEKSVPIEVCFLNVVTTQHTIDVLSSDV